MLEPAVCPRAPRRCVVEPTGQVGLLLRGHLAVVLPLGLGLRHRGLLLGYLVGEGRRQPEEDNDGMMEEEMMKEKDNDGDNMMKRINLTSTWT